MLKVPDHDHVVVLAQYDDAGGIILRVEFGTDGGDMTQSLSIRLDSLAAVRLHQTLGNGIVDMTIHEAEARIASNHARPAPIPKCPAEKFEKDCDRGCKLGQWCPRMPRPS